MNENLQNSLELNAKDEKIKKLEEQIIAIVCIVMVAIGVHAIARFFDKKNLAMLIGIFGFFSAFILCGVMVPEEPKIESID